MPSSSRYCNLAPPVAAERTAPVERAGPRVRIHRADGVETLWIDHEGPRVIMGIASTPRISSHKHSLSSAGCQIRFPIPLLSSHGFVGDSRRAPWQPEQVKIGEVVWIQKSSRAVRVRAVLDDNEAADYAWKLIESGEVRAFSVAAVRGTARVQGVVEGAVFFDRWKLEEVSVCRRGANPDCQFSIYRGP